MKKYYVAVVVLILLGGGYYWYSKSKSSNNQTNYVTATAEKGTITTSISASGNIVVDQSATVDPTISGTVANLTVQVGDNVQEGQHLFDIINGDLSVTVSKGVASLKQAENSVESAKVQENQAEADYNAAKKKNKTTPGTYTKEQLRVLNDKIDIAEEGITAAKKSLDATKADFENQQTEASKRQVTSPISGTVNEINIKNGDDLGKSSSSSTKTSPIIIGDLNTLKTQVQVNEVDIPSVSMGQKAMLTFDAIEGFTATGKIEKIDSLGTNSSNVVTYNVTIGFDSIDPRIKPGMSVSASIITAVKQDVIAVPNSAVKSQGGNSYVEVLNDGTQTPKQVNVEVGVSNNTDTEIVSGVKAGDKVVTQTINSNSNTNVNTNSSSTRRTGGFGIPGLGGGGPRD